MRKTKHKEPEFTLKGVTKKQLPTYVKVNGVVYEKITGKTGNLDLDLSPDVTKQLSEKVKSGHYVNEQEALRDALRTYMRECGEL